MSEQERTISRRAFLLSAGVFAVGAGFDAPSEDLRVATRLPPSLSPLATFTHLIPGMDARYSPSGEEIVFDRKGTDGYCHLWKAQADGTRATCLTCGNPSLPRHSGNGSWHPAGEWIVFQALKRAPHPQFLGDPMLGQHNDIWAISSSGGTAYKLYNLPCSGTRHYALLQPGFTPDGSKLAWGESYAPATLTDPYGRWRLMAADFNVAGGVPSLTNLQVLPDSAHPGYREFDEFLTTEELLVSANASPSESVTALDVYTCDLTTGEYMPLTDGPAFDEQAHASPYGIAFLSSMPYPPPRDAFDYTAKSELWLMDAGGSNLRQLSAFNRPAYLASIGATRATVAMLDWHPEGSKRLIASVVFTYPFGVTRDELFLGTLR